MLTIEQAANALRVSRSYLIGLLETGALACTEVDGHRLITPEDVVAYKQARESKELEALERLVELSQQDG